MLKPRDFKNGIVNLWQDFKEPLRVPADEAGRSVIGESVGRNPIYCRKVGSGEKKILFVSAVHGNEVGTVKLAYRLLGYLRRNKNRFEKLTCFIAPCLNPDGFAVARSFRAHFQSRLGRLNARGVDLNRNFPTADFRSRAYVVPRVRGERLPKYRKEIPAEVAEARGVDLSKSPDVKSCGAYGGSEPETKALLDLIEREKIRLIFSFHNLGEDVMGGKDYFSRELVRIYAEKSGYGIHGEAEWREIGQTGTMKAWCDERGISYVEVEGTTRYGSDWKYQGPALEAVLARLAGE